MFLLALACTSDEPIAEETGDTAPTEEPLLDPPPYSGGTCPALVEGVNDGFLSADLERSVRVLLPEEPQGAPVVFAWHWLGGSARDIERYMELSTLADDGAIVVSPDSSGETAIEWHTLDEAEGNPDLILFDDLLSCLWEQHEVDLGRVYALGMSAGGLWSSYLTTWRAEYLAATAPLSGGVVGEAFGTPADPIPVLLTWGGEGDVYGPFSFDEANRTFSADLQANGSFVVECVHDDGHIIPVGATAYVWQFLKDHPKRVKSEPYAEGLPEALPDWCAIP